MTKKVTLRKTVISAVALTLCFIISGCSNANQPSDVLGKANDADSQSFSSSAVEVEGEIDPITGSWKFIQQIRSGDVELREHLASSFWTRATFQFTGDGTFQLADFSSTEVLEITGTWNPLDKGSGRSSYSLSFEETSLEDITPEMLVSFSNSECYIEDGLFYWGLDMVFVYEKE